MNVRKTKALEDCNDYSRQDAPDKFCASTATIERFSGFWRSAWPNFQSYKKKCWNAPRRKHATLQIAAILGDPVPGSAKFAASAVALLRDDSTKLLAGARGTNESSAGKYHYALNVKTLRVPY